MADNKPTLVKPLEEVVPIAKPSAFDLEKFKSKRAAAIANVETLQTGLPHHSLTACEHAKTLWVQATSRRDENIDGYKIDFAHDQDAFPDPKWPLQSLGELIEPDVRRPHDRQRGSSGTAAFDRCQADRWRE